MVKVYTVSWQSTILQLPHQVSIQHNCTDLHTCTKRDLYKLADLYTVT